MYEVHYIIYKPNRPGARLGVPASARRPGVAIYKDQRITVRS